MNAEHWIIGPQLIGIIFLIVGYIQHRWPPKKINALYGYRMPSSMKNQETWDVANTYSAVLMMKMGALLIPVGLALSTLLSLPKITEDARMLICAGCMVVSAITTAVLLIVYTEKHLERTFNNN